ncbi:MAG: hypothetical protein H0V23_12110, partial [Nocardioidaceae bacterium]|nr:hypothetical protein [Nocardioidaceae bacterium]
SDGVRYENGEKVTVDDVAYGIKRSFYRRAFPNGPAYSNECFLDGDRYRGPYASGTSYPGIVIEGNTLTLKMAKPFQDMPYWAAWPAIGPIPERGSDPATYGRHPLATGPYRFADYTPGKSLTLVRNEYWDPDTDPGRHGYPDRYEFTFDIPVGRIDATILGDSAQAATTLSMTSVSADDYRRVAELNQLAFGSSPCTFFLSPDYRKITDVRVRQAIGYALPYRDVARLYGTLGVTVFPGTSILPPGFPGRQDYNPLETNPGRTDVGMARALLQEAGWSPGEFDLSFLYMKSDPVATEVIAEVAENLEAAGFNVTPFPTTSDEDFSEAYTDPNAPVNARLGGWCPDWASGSDWFPPVFQSDGEGNFAFFAEPEIDAEIERILGLPVEQQTTAWGALDRLIMTEYYPVIVTGHPGVAMPHGSRIGGMNADDVWHIPTWKDIHIIP